ncbi:hypothetical protein SERLA73DRAFT_189656 [Serpula lacrymans var. lacrymans S7.3]|uniref:AB hydrolase-1 domain-containing protein n=2 Tax=Serpula lacrymans var. lacrymans TaxID=341189 RepID=F8QEB6_SERL3|nr:uncharacterized protein SERLADRAFT_480540 [Serpula lacrymans var. lacrymans S7.9]EGN93491.1 hypothetical protein SERLA73DRAFT_189656 [Serpula lacrymans var. lacrymans S7.3]EGO18869.1 hypothetical protein SERLADRAFT_480540 [Serpula lacrymans var. lacrymans S7.9]
MTSTFTPIVKRIPSSDGTIIFAEAIGNPLNPGVIFVPGLCLDSIVFDCLFSDKALLECVYMVRYNMRGSGRSGKPTTAEGHASQLYADDWLAVARAFNLKNPVHVGWSYGATAVTDICANITPLPISGAVFLGGLPSVGLELRQKVLKPRIVSVASELIKPITSSWIPLKIDFIESLFDEKDHVPDSVKFTWLGSTVGYTPEDAIFALTRSQDPSKLFEAGSKGLPLLVISGELDTHNRGEVLVQEMEPHFKNIESLMIEGGSHAIFYTHQQQVVEALLKFMGDIQGGKYGSAH